MRLKKTQKQTKKQTVPLWPSSVIVLFSLKMKKTFVGLDSIMIFISATQSGCCDLIAEFLFFIFFAIWYLFVSQIVEWSYFFFLLQKDIEGFG